MRPDTTAERLAALKPVFRKGGVVTAGNASGIGDGAAALVIASEKFARDRQLTIAIIQQTAAQQPGIDPKIGSAEAALDRDLPETGRTEDRLVLEIIEQPARGSRQWTKSD